MEDGVLYGAKTLNCLGEEKDKNCIIIHSHCSIILGSATRGREC